METTKGPKRPAFNRTLGTSDDEHFHTLVPGEPKTFTHRFFVASREQRDNDIKKRQNALLAGHRYQFSIREGEQINRWWWGTREDVMAPAGIWRGLERADGEPISLADVAPVEIAVIES